MAARGIRMTRQRRVILQVMDNARQHLDVTRSSRERQKSMTAFHLVTVYRSA